jgi:hypothetical protein
MEKKHSGMGIASFIISLVMLFIQILIYNFFTTHGYSDSLGALILCQSRWSWAWHRRFGAEGPQAHFFGARHDAQRHPVARLSHHSNLDLITLTVPLVRGLR